MTAQTARTWTRRVLLAPALAVMALLSLAMVVHYALASTKSATAERKARTLMCGTWNATKRLARAIRG